MSNLSRIKTICRLMFLKLREQRPSLGAIPQRDRSKTWYIYVDLFDARGRRLAVNGILETHICKLWIILAQVWQPDMVIDIGANYGEVGLSCLYEGGKIFLIEPNLAVYNKLRKSALSHPNRKSINVINRAVTDNATSGRQQTLYVNRNWSGVSTLTRNEDRNWIPQKTRCITIDALLESDSVNNLLCKIDVEGAELKVLRGMERTLKKSQSTCILIELNKASLKAQGENPQELIETLQEYGNLYMIGDGETAPVASLSVFNKNILNESASAKTDLLMISDTMLLKQLRQIAEN